MNGDADRRLALRIMKNEQEASNDFLKLYEERMLALATRMTRGLTLDGKDLVQDFLTEKVYSNLEGMLGPVARGERPLWPRLSRSLANYCIDAIRRRNRNPVRSPQNESTSADAGSTESPPPTVTWEDVKTLVADRLVAIRDMDPCRAGHVPLRELLLLSERVILSRQVLKSLDGTGEQASGDMIPHAFRLAEEIGTWDEKEKDRLLPALEKSLSKVWLDIKEKTATETHPLDGYVVAEVLGATRCAWDQWVRRARLRLLESCQTPAACKELFFHWPTRMFLAAEQPLQVEGMGDIDAG